MNNRKMTYLAVLLSIVHAINCGSEKKINDGYYGEGNCQLILSRENTTILNKSFPVHIVFERLIKDLYIITAYNFEKGFAWGWNDAPSDIPYIHISIFPKLGDEMKSLSIDKLTNNDIKIFSLELKHKYLGEPFGLGTQVSHEGQAYFKKMQSFKINVATTATNKKEGSFVVAADESGPLTMLKKHNVFLKCTFTVDLVKNYRIPKSKPLG